MGSSCRGYTRTEQLQLASIQSATFVGQLAEIMATLDDDNLCCANTINKNRNYVFHFNCSTESMLLV